MSGTGWTRTAPPKPKLSASSVGITAAGRAAASSAVSGTSYRDAAERALVAQKHSNAEVARMMDTSEADKLEALPSKAERLKEEGVPLKGVKHTAKMGMPYTQPDKAAECNAAPPAPAVDPRSGLQDAIRGCLPLLDDRTVEYLVDLLADADNEDSEAREVVAEALEAHGADAATVESLWVYLAASK
eukprot:TRINITY_DN80256_c0_g1_i1.p1 TRINITY_DN80256_c0_g1~~TRINITY_DN80256_c0_g1_i1.p1  ORF type:complete len:187 (+),score=49.16 TRINITY_DN80256_c0_g1_i1:142-702(+)